MLLVACSNCYTAVRVMGEEAHVDSLVGRASEFWPTGYTCVSCGKPCEGMSEVLVDPALMAQMKVRDLGPNEYYSALLGLGTPDEMQCDATTVRELLKQRVRHVGGFVVKGTTRFCMTDLEVEDGTKLYLGASTHGAVVYRIARPVSYTQKVLEEIAGG